MCYKNCAVYHKKKELSVCFTSLEVQRPMNNYCDDSNEPSGSKTEKIYGMAVHL